MSAVARSLKKAELLELLEKKNEQLESLLATQSSGPFTAGEVEGKSVLEVIELAISAKRMVSWQAGAMVVSGKGGFFPSEIPAMVKAFNDAFTGADALLVNRKGEYSSRAPIERHKAWCVEHGLPEPGVKVASKRKKKAKKEEAILEALKLLLK